MLFTDDMLTEISRTLAVVYMYIKEIPRLKNKTLNLSVKIEKFIKQFLQIQAIFWSETCLVTTVVIALFAKYKAEKRQNSLVTIGELQWQKLHVKTMTNVQILIPIHSEFIVEKGMVVAVLSYDPNPLSSKSSDRKCLVNIRDILKRYF